MKNLKILSFAGPFVPHRGIPSLIPEATFLVPEIQLEELELSTCHITEKILARVSKIQRLKCLELFPYRGSQYIIDDGLQHLVTMPELRELVLNNVSDRGIRRLRGMPSLRVLSVSGRFITESGLKHVCTLTGLEELDLLGVPFTHAQLSHLTSLTNLKILTVEITHTTNDDPSWLSQMKGLEELEIKSDDAIDDRGLQHIGQLTHLKKLKFGGFRSRISETGLRHLTQLNQLRSLVFWAADHLSDESLSRLSKELPQLEISCGSRTFGPEESVP